MWRQVVVCGKKKLIFPLSGHMEKHDLMGHCMSETKKKILCEF